MSAPLLQLLSVGTVWIFFHCSPMCGPIVSGLRLTSLRSLLLYQLGRGIIYGVAGFLAGSLGSKISFKHPKLGWLIVFFLLVLTVSSFKPSLFEFKMPSLFKKLSQKFSSIDSSLRPVFLGFLLAFLPCTLSLWALGLASQTGGGLEGMFLMWTLILLTTLPLAATSFVTQKFHSFKKFKLTPLLLLISTLWTALITLAASGVIAHQHISLRLLDKSYVLMFW